MHSQKSIALCSFVLTFPGSGRRPLHMCLCVSMRVLQASLEIQLARLFADDPPLPGLIAHSRSQVDPLGPWGRNSLIIPRVSNRGMPAIAALVRFDASEGMHPTQARRAVSSSSSTIAIGIAGFDALNLFQPGRYRRAPRGISIVALQRNTCDSFRWIVLYRC